MTVYSNKEKTILGVLGILCFAFLYIAITPWVLSPLDYLSFGNRTPPQESQKVLPKLPVLEKAPLKRFRTITTRPIFIATSRLATTTPSLDNDKLVLGRYVITGIVVSPNRRVIYLKTVRSGKTLTVARGEKLDGWIVSEIKRDMIVLTAGEKQKRYMYRDDTTSTR